MAKLVWDNTGDHLYETGTKNAVLYVYDDNIADFSATQASYAVGDVVRYSGDVYICKEAISSAGEWTAAKWQKATEYCKDVSAWNGITAVTESPSGADETKLYANDIKYLSLRAAEEFGATIEAYTYPDAWGQCDGSSDLFTGISIGQQKRARFGLAYKTVVGNDVSGNDYGYKIHLIYGCTASPSERAYQTINDSPEAITFSWEMTTVPVNIATAGFKPTANVIIDSTKIPPNKQTVLAQLEKNLFGADADGNTAQVFPYLPLPDEIYTMFNTAG